MLAQSYDMSNPQPAQERECGNCHATIYVLKDEQTGRYAEIDQGFTHEGDVLINLTRGTYSRVGTAERLIHGRWLRALHRQVCSGINLRQPGMW